MVYIDIITGFLESGKTTFINELLENEAFEEYNKIILVICEEGFTQYDENELRSLNVVPIFLENESDLTNNLFNSIESKYCPDYVLVEYNGTWNISKIIGLKTPKFYKLRNIILISNAESFNNQLDNMASLMQPHILNSDVVVFNRFKKLNEKAQKKLAKVIKNINPKTKVTFYKRFRRDKILKERFIMSKDSDEKLSNMTTDIEISALLILCYAVICVFREQNTYTYIQYMATVFLGILMQAIPFILLGAFISSIIQIFTSNGWMMRQISKGRWYSFLIAAFAGIFMPICDCGMVPIISGLLKKNTPLPQTMTFWLSSSAVSPVVILSMLYAFPDKPYLAVVRFIAGLFIGITVGLVLKLFNLETGDVVCQTRRVQNIGKDILDLKYKGLMGKIEAVFAGAKVEFFRVAEYVIAGALISAVLQTVLPQTMKNIIGQNIIIQFAIMIAASMLMSTCSTSNAFIGRSFSNNFSTVPILSFIIVGPMLDLKNMIMLSEILKKRFLFFLAFLVILESIIVFGALSFCF
ncbi:MAG: permease [Clostridia bacterium]|jgi:uncharacterized membrane protein YraQ (UPF0718 family)|nr:permease [Clostridia bacterium]